MDGIVVTARRVDVRKAIDIAAPSLPVVYAFSQTDDPQAHCILPDDEGGAMLATGHLAGLGRQRIAHVTGPERFHAVRSRRDGYRKAVRRFGLTEAGDHYLPGVWSEGWGREAVAQLFRAASRAPDAIFCGSDQIARGAADALRERGVRVPQDVALVGFDNWDVIAEATRPSLTTVDMNLRELGREAGSRLIKMIAGADLTGALYSPAKLVIRESCGAGRPGMPA